MSSEDILREGAPPDIFDELLFFFGRGTPRLFLDRFKRSNSLEVGLNFLLGGAFADFVIIGDTVIQPRALGNLLPRFL
jgi:hypothetical protein